MFLHTAPLSAGPPSPSTLFEKMGQQHHTKMPRLRICLPSHVLSIHSPTAAMSGLIMGPGPGVASGSKGSEAADSSTKLEFCDRCMAAYPLDIFPTHVCCDN